MSGAVIDYDAELQLHNKQFRAALGIRAADRVLDIGCGTGQTTREAARVASFGDALGVDIDAGMIARARELADREGLKLHQLNPAVAVRCSHQCDVASNVVKPDEAVHRRSLDCRLALQLETKLDKEGNSSREVVDHNANVVHPPNRHVPSMVH